MPYVAQQDLVDRFGEGELIRLTNPDDFSATAVDTARLDGAIADADAMIDGYLGGRYEIPLSPVPRAITRVAADLARYYLYDDQPPDTVAQRYEDAMKFLRSVARREVSLGVSEGGEQASGADLATLQSDGRTFGRGEGGLI